MQAGASMPLASRVVHIDGKALLDGGMTDSIPLAKFQEMGYDKNIVILTQPREFTKKPDSLLPLMRLSLRKYPKLLAQMEANAKKHDAQPKKSGFMSRLEAMQREQQRLARENAKAQAKKYR